MAIKGSEVASEVKEDAKEIVNDIKDMVGRITGTCDGAIRNTILHFMTCKARTIYTSYISVSFVHSFRWRAEAVMDLGSESRGRGVF
jgi:hypothetical protein